jgi:lysophospholipase L1-like esterase
MRFALGLLAIGPPLARVARRLARGEPVTIVAIGSSSTEGAGASTIAANYPSRLEAELRGRVPGGAFRVINRGVGGEDMHEMLARFDRHVRDEHPDLVLWQLGTNALLGADGVAGFSPLMSEGVRRIRAAGADAILIDPQYAPKVLRDPDADNMVTLINEIARLEGTALFQRFALMRHWVKGAGIPFERFLSPDPFHMNDWSYRCFAETLARAIVATLPALPVAEARPATTVSAAAAAPRASGQSAGP